MLRAITKKVGFEGVTRESEVIVNRGVIFSAVLLLHIAAAGASERRCIQQTRYWGGDGQAQHLVVVNGHAFFGGFTLRVADLADPTDPVVVHEVRLDGYAFDLEAHGDRIYATDFSDEITVIDAGGPSKATIEGRYLVEEPGWKLGELAIQGDLGVVIGQTYSAGPVSKLYTFDPSGADPRPEVLGSVIIVGSVEALALGSGVAVAATGADQLFFIDVSDPAAPVVTAEFNAGDWLVSGGVAHLEASEDLLAISDTEGLMMLVDISVPSEPEYLSLIQGLDIGVVTMEFEGPTIHVVGSTCTPLGVCGGYALINALAPRSPNVVGRLDGPKMMSPAPHAGHVMAAAFQAGMRVVDLRGLTDPAMLDVVLPAREVGAIASADRLVHVVDVTSLAAPEDPDRNTLKVLMRSADGSIAETAAYGPEGAIWALAADGNYVAAAFYDEETEFHSVEIIDVSDPAAPEIGYRLGARLSQDYETYTPHLRMHDDRLYLSLKDSNEILIYELSEGGVATQVGDYSPGAEMLHFAVASRDVMAVAVRDGDTGWIEIVDTRVPSSSVVAGIFDLPEPADVPVTVEAEGHRVAVLCKDFDGFNGPYNYSILVDIADPFNPTLALDLLPGGWWIALGAGVLHTIGDTYPPSGVMHTAMSVTNPPDVGEADTLGYLEIYRDRVDADGPYFCLSRNRLEVHRYGNCGPLAATIRTPTSTE